MTMTETKLSDEEIQRLIKKNLRAVRAESANIAIFDQNAEALRQLQAALKEDKRRMDLLEQVVEMNGQAFWDAMKSLPVSKFSGPLKAALQQEKGDG